MNSALSLKNLPGDLTAGWVLSLVALPLCMGVAVASGAPLFSGILAGIIGGAVVGSISGSQLSVSGPSPALTAIISAKIASLGSFETFLAAVVISGVVQVALGLVNAGWVAAFFPSSVIKGLLAAVGLILILKQAPHAVGHDPDPEGDMSFSQLDEKNTFSELFSMLDDFQYGATLIGLVSLAIMFAWQRVSFLKRSPVPAPLAVVALGVLAAAVMHRMGEPWRIDASHLLQIPEMGGWNDFKAALLHPDWAAFKNPEVLFSGVLLAVVSSLETLLNVEVIDRLDPLQRSTPVNRELLAQGAGNIAGGLLGALPVSSVIVRSSVNINARAKTKTSAVSHGFFLLVSVLFFPLWLNQIPLSCLAAVLIATGVGLTSPAIFRQMWREGRSQLIPFMVTVLGIMFSDMLTGILLGATASFAFILRSSFMQPIHRVMERHVSGDVLRVGLPNQVNFFKRAAIEKVLREVPRGGNVLLDARTTSYIDPDILDFIEDFGRTIAPAHGVRFSKIGFKEKYRLEDDIQFIDYSTREVQSSLTPAKALEVLIAGNERFCSGHRIERDLTLQRSATADGQFPMAVIFSCIDSRTPVEMVFDLGLGDVFSVRIAGTIAREKVLASMEYGCLVAGARLLVVMGHSSCGAVGASVSLFDSEKSVAEATGCGNLDALVSEIQNSINATEAAACKTWVPPRRSAYIDMVAKRNVVRTIQMIHEKSRTLDALVRERKIAIVGAFQDVKSGRVGFYRTALSNDLELNLPSLEEAIALEASV